MSVIHFEDVSELPDHFFREIKNFFEDYKKLEHKTSVVEEFGGKTEALKIVNKALDDYKLRFSN